jgi:alpha-amylase
MIEIHAEVRHCYGSPRMTAELNDRGFDGSINMGFASHLAMPLPALYRAFDAELTTGPFAGRATPSYLASHDDMESHDQARAKHFEAAEALLLAPGGAQIYYGDEIAR